MGREDHAGGGADSREFLYCDGVHDVVPSCPAVFNGEGNAEESERSHLLDRLYGESLLFVDLSCQGLYLFLGELPDHLPEKRLCRCEFEIHIQ